jgi:cytochrome c oxidase subunit II
MSILQDSLELARLYHGTASIYSPAGSDASRLSRLGLEMTVAGSAITVAIILVLGWALARRARRPISDGDAAPIVSERGWIGVTGLALPMAVLAGVFVITVVTLHAMPERKGGAGGIAVVGRQWWWEVHYTADSFATANEIHIAQGKAASIRLTSPDVIHSLWVPRLNGKTDVIPGQVNVMHLSATDTGVYRGMCAEYCGTQHARMAMTVVVESDSAHKLWLAQQRRAASAPVDSIASAGEQEFRAHSCAFCHTIRGTAAGGTAGPDLTHIGSRLTLASGTLLNTTANLRLWIGSAQHVKPGSTMPEVALDSASRTAIAEYLHGLR